MNGHNITLIGETFNVCVCVAIAFFELAQFSDSHTFRKCKNIPSTVAIRCYQMFVRCRHFRPQCEKENAPTIRVRTFGCHWYKCAAKLCTFFWLCYFWSCSEFKCNLTTAHHWVFHRFTQSSDVESQFHNFAITSLRFGCVSVRVVLTECISTKKRTHTLRLSSGLMHLARAALKCV